MSPPKISFISALIMSINIMLGSGIFINTVVLSKALGGLGAYAYLLVGLLIFPLIISMARLMKIHRGGTFYDFGATLHPFIGFISIWGYFTAKIASAALGVHIFVTLLQLLIPSFSTFSTLKVDGLIIIIFGMLSILNIRITRYIQTSFIFLKLIPLLAVICAALFLFSIDNYQNIENMWNTIPATIPFILFAFSGFEAVCSLSQSIDQPEKNGPHAILYSFGIVLVLMILYQASFFGILGMKLATFSTFRQAYPALFSLLFTPHSSLYNFFNFIALMGIASSSLGASYSILYSNAWNLYTLAQKNQIPFSSFFRLQNRYLMPLVCIFVEIAVAFIYLYITKGNQISLQQISAIGSTMTYSVSVLSLFFISCTMKKNRLMAFLGLISCGILSWALFKNGFQFGLKAYGLFGYFVLIGIIIFCLNTLFKKINAISA